jgi:hypothetical protein
MYSTHLRRSRQVVALAAGLALATALSAAPAGAQAPSGFSGQPDRGSTEVVPLSAELRITRTIVDADGQQRIEHETNRLYRDSLGRTRTEDGSSITISDPASGVVVVLDTEARTFQRTARDESSLDSSAAAARPEGTTAPNQQLSSTPRSLGAASISGVRVQGKEYTVTTPARENFPGREREVTMWVSTDVQLPVQTRVVEGSGEAYEQTYTNIQAGTEPAAALFQVPAGYHEANPAAARSTQTNRSVQATCPIDYLDPVILFTYAGWWMYSPVPAVTDVNAGCVFVADAAVWEWPLSLTPALPLLLPVDQWDAWYYGASLPWAWLPYTAFGDVAFAAASTGDATVVDSLVILEIF